MKKGETFELEISGINFNGEGYGEVDGEKYFVKGCIPFEKVKVRFIKVKSGRKVCKIVEKIKESPISIKPICEKFGECGGCTYLNLSYDDQIKFKEEAIKNLLKDNEINYDRFLGIQKAPHQFEYRNKMEFSFGDEFKGGQLELGLHKKGNPFSVVPTYSCHLISEDFRKIMKSAVKYFREINAKPYKLKNHEGYLRNLILRDGKNEILICLVTSSQNDFDLTDFKKELLGLNLNKEIGGIVHIISDSLSDAIKAEKINILYGNDFIYEEILGLQFKLNLFSFFQTNTEGMKILYERVRDSIKNSDGIILDLYCGIGTIGQILSDKLKNEVVGIEIVSDAVFMARENSKLNNLNCKFIEGDVSDVVKEINEKISLIVVDPPRAGIMEKGVKNICNFNVKNIVYISCNPKTLVEDLKIFLNFGYNIDSIECIDMFPNTFHVETVVLMSKVNDNK